MENVPFTIDEMVYSTNNVGSVLGENTRIYFVTKNKKDYWDFDTGFFDGRKENHIWAST